MPRQLKCKVCPEWHDTDEPWPMACAGHFRRHDQKRSTKFPAPYVISDDLGPAGVLNHADGKTYTSKSEYMRAVKAAGCEVLGSKETLPRPTPKRFKLDDGVKREVAEMVRALDSPTRKKRGNFSRDHFGGSRRFLKP